MTILTLSQMEDEAQEEGAASIQIGKYEWVKAVDTGSWWHVTLGGERRIDRKEADIRRMNFIDPTGGWLEDLT